jgi:hypothetical protein
MTVIRTTTLGVAVLGVGLALAGCATPAAKTATSVAPAAAAATSPAPPAPVAAAPVAQVAPVAQTVQVAPVAPVVSAAPVAPSSAPPSPPVVATTATTPPSASASPSASAPPSVKASPSASTPPSSSAPHFTTPDAAMRYLVAAYNSHNIAAEMHVTTPDSRAALETERQWVNTFSFHSCTLNPGGGDYSCQFDMVSKVKTTTSDDFNPFGQDVVENMGEITVLVAPAQRPGWYMYFNEGCGDALVF